MLTSKCLRDLAPKYLNELLELRKAFRCTRSACDELLLEVWKIRLATAGAKFAFSVTKNAGYVWMKGENG